uniref:Tim44-like domain-containing protein n=1 Tax=Phaeomonas parva TaxID=124430 RepID=A0A7S1XKH2_9STRA
MHGPKQGAAGAAGEEKKEGEEEEQPKQGGGSFVNSYKEQGAKAAGLFGSVQSFLVTNVREGWRELTGGQAESPVRVRVGNKKRTEVEKAADDAKVDAEEAEAAERSTRTDLVISDGPSSAWQELSKRLREAPVIRGVLKSGRAVYRDVADSSVGKGAKKVGEKVQDKIDDLKEAWETSQHPIVYGISSAWDSITAETEEGYTLRELRRLDPGFNHETWRYQVTEEICPGLLAAYLKGSPREMKEWVGEGVYNRIAEEMRARKAEGLEMDQTVLDIETGEILAMKVEEGQGPTIVMQFMAQQIYCVRKRETGEIVEGAEDDIKAYFYALAFNQVFDEDEMEVRYEVVDFLPVGSVPYY